MISDTATESTKPLRVLIAMGTRPEIIKQAPLVWAARRHPAVQAVVCHSGQHADLAEPMLNYFDVQPELRFDLMASHSTLPALVAACMQCTEQVLKEQRMDVVVVQGDTATTAAMSLAAFYSRVPVVHIEAGLRTGNIRSPWPEELNRRVATLCAELHCAPTEYAQQQLLAENVEPARIFVSGNPVVDALQWTLDRLPVDVTPQDDRPRVVLTAHRRENFGRPLEDICSAVLELTRRYADHQFVFVTHPNPQAGPVVRSILDGNERITVAQPMGYPQFISLLRSSRLIISDSGGIQEEASTLRVPLLITRESTERPEAVHCGAAELVGTDRERLIARASQLLEQPAARQRMQVPRNPFGDGQAGTRIMEQIVRRFGSSS